MDVDRPAGKKREGMMMTGPTPMQPPAPKPRPPPVVTDMVPKAIPSAQSFDISTPPPQRSRPPPAGLNAAPPMPAVPLPGSSTDPPPLQVFSQTTDPPPAPPTFAPAPRKRATNEVGPPKKKGRPTLEEQIQRVRHDYSISADERMDRILKLQARIDKRAGKNRGRAPQPPPSPPAASATKRKAEEQAVTTLAPVEEETALVLHEKPKKPRAKAKATPAIKDSVVAEAKPKPRARASKNAPLLAIEGPEQPKALPPPARSGPPKGKKPTIQVLPLTDATSSSVNKDGILKPKPKGRPRKATPMLARLVAPTAV